ncbi:hypothetical protein I7I50_07226 [Histoplasma capsulatum G186AR]|uniref:Uncharacterized protein n=1 Tax=Ajellomyces capsulatus TaxID=5037 RepID=A0A8H7Z1B7_AJECA|nr:hypothetical protein I7I52_09702 [Histoplasma capsulatum]QSS67979.1 hypothetical protein I7I50_07226 [Histoplasma capsulatum G186AR]
MPYKTARTPSAGAQIARHIILHLRCCCSAISCFDIASSLKPRYGGRQIRWTRYRADVEGSVG